MHLSFCCSKAAEELPASLEFLVIETRHWFTCSPLRQLQYESLYITINIGKAHHKMIQLSKTRWLAWNGAITSILEHSQGNIPKTNLPFQADSTEITKLFKDLRLLLLSVARTIIKPAFVRPTGNTSATHRITQQTWMHSKYSGESCSGKSMLENVCLKILFSFGVQYCNTQMMEEINHLQEKPDLH
ncbi:hypothetical protein PR048_005400 [Dryococelus australis]|uniref:Uncharacterized protein n=1 Tax=Dryococelus australis TaxID=614101 RepID=A0ABQ9I841_9NEOP|nr:hypothetical protein PR048_005400 [Dryococelus australis]